MAGLPPCECVNIILLWGLISVSRFDHPISTLPRRVSSNKQQNTSSCCHLPSWFVFHAHILEGLNHPVGSCLLRLEIPQFAAHDSYFIIAKGLATPRQPGWPDSNAIGAECIFHRSFFPLGHATCFQQLYWIPSHLHTPTSSSNICYCYHVGSCHSHLLCIPSSMCNPCCCHLCLTGTLPFFIPQQWWAAKRDPGITKVNLWMTRCRDMQYGPSICSTNCFCQACNLSHVSGSASIQVIHRLPT